MVGCRLSRVTKGIAIIFQRARFNGVGKVSQPARNKKERCFSGKPCIIFSTGDVLVRLRLCRIS